MLLAPSVFGVAAGAAHDFLCDIIFRARLIVWPSIND
jgi:hypothetical protein